MYIHDMTHRVVSPPTGAGDQSAGVSLHHEAGQLDGVMLTPAFVEHDPEDDAGMVPQLVHPNLGLILEHILGDAVCLFHVDGVSDAGEVLPD